MVESGGDTSEIDRKAEELASQEMQISSQETALTDQMQSFLEQVKGIRAGGDAQAQVASRESAMALRERSVASRTFADSRGTGGILHGGLMKNDNGARLHWHVGIKLHLAGASLHCAHEQRCGNDTQRVGAGQQGNGDPVKTQPCVEARLKTADDAQRLNCATHPGQKTANRHRQNNGSRHFDAGIMRRV